MKKEYNFAVGQKVGLVPFQHKGKLATVRYIGPLAKRFGTWVGLELESATGDCNGTFGEEKLFKCPENFGLLLRIT
jgi:dynactin complex subunit